MGVAVAFPSRQAYSKLAASLKLDMLDEKI